MVDRSLLGVLLIALVSSSCAYFAFTAHEPEKLSLLEMKVPESMFYSENEYHFAASLLARTDIQEAEIRLHWLRSVGKERLEGIRQTFGVQPFDGDAMKTLLSAPFVGDVTNLTLSLGIEPTLLDEKVSIEGKPHRLILASIGPAQGIFMPARIGRGEGVRPTVAGDYAVLVNRSGQLVNFYSGYAAVFYDPERTLKSLEVDLNREKTIYQNRSPESSLPRLRDVPAFGILRLPAKEGDRVDLLLSVDGRTLRAWRPNLCVAEIWVDGKRQEARAFLIR